MNPDPQNNSGNLQREERLPFDVWTIAVGLIRRWKIFALIIVVFAGLAAAGGMALGSRTYQAHTVLLYKPISLDSKQEVELKSSLEADTVMQYRQGGGEEDQRQPADLQTRRHMVKLPGNLEETRARLQLPLTVVALGALAEVTIQKDTDLMIISAEGDTPEMSAKIANTLRDVFLENLEKLRKNTLEKQIRFTQKRLTDIQEKWQSATDALTQFINKNQIVDINEEVRWRMSDLSSLDRDYQSVLQERDTLKVKIDNAEKLMQDLQAKAAEEKKAMAQTQNVQDLSIRIERLRDSIYDDKLYRSNMADLAQKEIDAERAKRLFKQGMITKVDYDKAISAYEKQKAVTVDTDQIKTWKKEIEKLQTSINPTNDEKTPSTSMMQDMMIRMMDVQLDLVAAEERLSYIDGLRKEAKTKLDELPSLQRQYTKISREASAVEAERRTLDNYLNQLQLRYNTEKPDFEIVSAAVPPAFPISSNRRLIAIAIAFMGFVFGATAILGLELLDTTIKSAAEAELKFALPILGVIPRFPPGIDLASGARPRALLEAFRAVAQKIRRRLPDKGARLLVVSAGRNEGRTLVASSLAMALGRQDEHVLIIDCHIRAERESPSILNLIKSEGVAIRGVGEYLSYETDRVDDVIWPIESPGVECLPCAGVLAAPDLLGSNRMKELVEEVRKNYSIIVFDSSPVFPVDDASQAAKWCDGIVWVIRSRKQTVSLIQSAIEQIKDTGVPILGIIVNDVEPVYLNYAQKQILLKTDAELA